MSTFGSITRPLLCLFHGGRLVGPVELRTKSKSMVHGPGFYMTTSYWTAREYRGGGGFVSRVCIEPDIRWAHQVRVSLPEALRFLDSIPKLKKRKDVVADLQKYMARANMDTVSFTAILNTLDLHGSYGPAVAQDVADALVRFGVDASMVPDIKHDEDWMVLHNVAKVRSVERLANEAPDAPRLKE